MGFLERNDHIFQQYLLTFVESVGMEEQDAQEVVDDVRAGPGGGRGH